MIHQGERCLTVVDRSVDPVVHLAYTIPYLDTCLTDDELPQSRTHQAVAFCRDDAPARIVPHWHTRAEADAAVAAGQPMDAVPAADVLEDSPDFAGCWFPLIAAADRRPITCDAARPGIDWDTTGLPAGTYRVRGYTYEPPLNAWSARRGLFKVVDGPDPADAPPAVGFSGGDLYLWKRQPTTLRLCADAMDGSTVTLAYGESAPETAWTAFVVDEPVVGDELVVPWTPPDELGGKVTALRAEIVDPLGRRFTAYRHGELFVQTVEDPNPPDTAASDESGESSGEPYDFCADNPAADDPLDCPDPGGPSGGEDPPAAPGDGCCSVHGPPSPLALLALLGLRRRRRAAV